MEQKQEANLKKWAKRGGIAAFLFFFFKGMIWVGVFTFLWMSKGC